MYRKTYLTKCYRIMWKKPWHIKEGFLIGGGLILLGLLLQVTVGPVDWSFFAWPFAIIWTWMMIISALAALNHLLRWKVREIPFLLNHLGALSGVFAPS